MKEVIGSSSCSCAAVCDTGGSSNSMSMKERPTMEELHIMLANHDWHSIQAAILKDSSIAMRIDDSREEDMWFNEARRLKAISEGIDISSMSNKQDDEKGDKSDNSTQDDDEDDTSQLRYWAQPNSNANLLNIDATIRARTSIQQKKTLLHSLLRMQFDSNESLVVQLTHGDNDLYRAKVLLRQFDAVLLTEKLDDIDQADFLSDVMGVPRDSSFSLANKNITANTLVEKSDKREKTRFYRDLLMKLGLKDILSTLEEENKLEIEFFHYAEKLNDVMLDQWKTETGYNLYR